MDDDAFWIDRYSEYFYASDDSSIATFYEPSSKLPIARRQHVFRVRSSENS